MPLGRIRLMARRLVRQRRFRDTHFRTHDQGDAQPRAAPFTDLSLPPALSRWYVASSSYVYRLGLTSGHRHVVFPCCSLYVSRQGVLCKRPLDSGPEAIAYQIEVALGDVNDRDRPFWWREWDDGKKAVSIVVTAVCEHDSLTPTQTRDATRAP